MNPEKLVPLTLILMMGLIGCTTAPKLAQEPLPSSTFLDKNQRLEPQKTAEEDTRLWLYRDQSVRTKAYSGLILEPVYLKPDAGKEVSLGLLRQAKTQLDSALSELVIKQRRLKLVKEPGLGVARVSFAITGAEISSDPFQPWHFLPIGLVLSGVTYSTGTNSKTPALLVEGKITDSQTNQLLAQGVIIAQGESFRTIAGSEEAFTAMTQKVVRAILENTPAE